MSSRIRLWFSWCKYARLEYDLVLVSLELGSGRVDWSFLCTSAPATGACEPILGVFILCRGSARRVNIIIGKCHHYF